jgi:hypothetical protein
MNLRLRLPLVLLAMLFGLVVVAVSGAAFNPPFYYSPPKQAANGPDASVSPQGKAFVVWQRFDQATGDEVVEMRLRTSTGTFSTPQILSAGGHDAVGAKVATWSGGCVVVWQAQNGDVASTTPVQGKTCGTDGALGPLFAVSPHPGGSFSIDAHPHVAVAGSGKAFFSWIGYDSQSKKRVFARTRTAGGTFGPTLSLSPQGVGDSVMAVNANGAAVFVWVWNDGAGHNLIEARQLSAGGALGSIKIIGKGIEFQGGGGAGTGNPSVAEDSQGNALIAWEQPDGAGACGINGCPKVLARTLSSTGTVGTVPQTLTTTVNGGKWPQIAMIGNGNAYVVWKHAGIEGRTRAANGTLGQLQKLTSSTSADYPLLKGDASGNTVTAWQNGGRVEARARTAGGALGPFHSFSIGGQIAGGGSLGVGSGGPAIVTWVQSDGLGQCSGGSSCSRVGASAGP